MIFIQTSTSHLDRNLKSSGMTPITEYGVSLITTFLTHHVAAPAEPLFP